MTKPLDIYVDGSAREEYGAFALRAYDDTGCVFEYTKECQANSNVCEMMAIAFAMHYFKDYPNPITIHSDSQYAVNGVNETITLTKNKPLWDKIHQLRQSHIRVCYVKGHDKCDRNKAVDKLARKAMRHYYRQHH